MSDSKPYIDSSMFSKPPPNFKNNNSYKWNNFKVPKSPMSKKNNKPHNAPSNSRKYPDKSYSYPSSSKNYSSRSSPNSPGSQKTSRNFNNTSPSRNFKNEPPPNYSGQRSVSPLSDGNYKHIVYNPIGVMQSDSFKPNVPPPNMLNNENKSNENSTQPHQLGSTPFDGTNYYMDMMYRYQQVDYSQSILAYSPSSVQPPPPNYPPPQQPPLPPGAPPQNPPPPPSDPSQRGSSPSGSLGINPVVLQQQGFSGRQGGPAVNHQQSRYHGNMPNPYTYNHQFNKQLQYNLKRKFDTNKEQKKAQKKKKKPLSQVVPQKRDWPIEDAKEALEVEKECNKRSKRQGLIIKFPDQELNRDIVTNFHASIESVHFQQPSTPRYCFVTLADSADPETVIKQLNQIPFGLGYLTAEFKKDREDEQNIKPSDIDPFTLYVGNLAQEITKEDMIKAYPKQKRIDIGYAKKMKYTRYAFVSFYTVEDAIEAFKRTHSSQMYSKSLIVRFRRLHGTVGMPGEPRVQPTLRSTPEPEPDPTSNENINPWDINVSNWDHYQNDMPDNSASEGAASDEEDETMFKTKFHLRAESELMELPYVNNVNMKQIKTKEEPEDEPFNNGYPEYSSNENNEQYLNTQAPDHPGPNEQIRIKQEEIKLEYPDEFSTQFRIILPNNSKTMNNMQEENQGIFEPDLLSSMPQPMVVKKEIVDTQDDNNCESGVNSEHIDKNSVQDSENSAKNDTSSNFNSSYSSASNNMEIETNFSWMNLDIRNKEIKTELDNPTGDDDSSEDDDLPIDGFLKRA